MFRFRRALALSTVGLLALAACGSDDSSSDATAAPAATPAATAAPDGVAATDPAVSTPATDAPDASGPVPMKIVSLYPTGTEMLYAIGAGDQVIAVDDQSNFPDEALAKKTDLSGFEPNVEAIAAYKPDLVIHDGTTPDLGTQLDSLGIPQWVGPAATDFDDIYTQLEQLGATTGHVAEAAELVGQMQKDIADTVATIPTGGTPLTYFHELDNTYYTVTSDTFIGQVYSLFGMQNIADTAEATSPYPQLSAEFVISQNPDIIFLGDADYGESVETVDARPGWDVINAVKNGNVVPISADLSSRWGPRVVDFVEAVAAANAAANAAASVPA
ncbi:MAG: putative transporter substrate-binding protein [Ilumatobacteraceae bacterium]|nr:putative transporter substrate-binding protein [Ilumatobacteraceae bacterium]